MECLTPPCPLKQEVEEVTRHFAALRDANARLNTCRNTVTELSEQSEGQYWLACLPALRGDVYGMMRGGV